MNVDEGFPLATQAGPWRLQGHHEVPALRQAPSRPGIEDLRAIWSVDSFPRRRRQERIPALRRGRPAALPCRVLPLPLPAPRRPKHPGHPYSLPGGLEVGRYVRSASLVDLRERVNTQCQQYGSDQQTLAPNIDLSSQDSINFAGAHLSALRDTFASSGLPVGTLLGPAGLRQATINAAAGPTTMADRRLLKMYIGSDVTLGDCRGRTTVWGSTAGSGTTVLRHSIDWANFRGLPASDDILVIGRNWGGFHDLWPVSVKRPWALTAAAAKGCRTLVSIPAVVAKHHSIPTLLVLHSLEVCQVARHGWEASPWFAAASAEDAVATKRPKCRCHLIGLAGEVLNKMTQVT